MTKDLPTLVQEEVARLRGTIAETKALFPGGNQVNFFFYNMAIAEAERAVREQDVVAMVNMLSELREME